MPRKPTSYDPARLSDIPLTLHAPDFLAAWRDWCEDRRERRKPMTRRAATIALNKLATMTPDAAAAAIRYSIERGYTGIFPDPQYKPAHTMQATGTHHADSLPDAWRDAAKQALRNDPDLALYGLTYDAIQSATSDLQFHPTVRAAVKSTAYKMRLNLGK